MDISYLLNSGFLVRDGKTLLVFDDYDDPAGAVDAAYDGTDFDNLYIFVTHAHFDHFGTRIRAESFALSFQQRPQAYKARQDFSVEQNHLHKTLQRMARRRDYSSGV